MNNTFNFKRFGKYLGYDLKSVWKEQRIFLLTYALIPVIMYVTVMFFALVGHGFSINASDFSGASPGLASRVSVFTIVSLIFLMFFPSRTFGFVTDKAKGSAWIQMPASRLEKFTSMMLTCLVIIPAAFFCAYLLSDAVICLIDKSCGSSILSEWNSHDFAGIDVADDSISFAGNGFWFLAGSIMQVVSIFLLGALIFKKNKVAKTILALFVLSLVLSAFLGIFFSTINVDVMSERLSAWASEQSGNIKFWVNLWSSIEFAIVVIGLGVWSWFRVKNIQH